MIFFFNDFDFTFQLGRSSRGSKSWVRVSRVVCADVDLSPPRYIPAAPILLPDGPWKQVDFYFLIFNQICSLIRFTVKSAVVVPEEQWIGKRSVYLNGFALIESLLAFMQFSRCTLYLNLEKELWFCNWRRISVMLGAISVFIYIITLCI